MQYSRFFAANNQIGCNEGLTSVAKAGHVREYPCLFTCEDPIAKVNAGFYGDLEVSSGRSKEDRILKKSLVCHPSGLWERN